MTESNQSAVALYLNSTEFVEIKRGVQLCSGNTSSEIAHMELNIPVKVPLEIQERIGKDADAFMKKVMEHLESILQ